MREKKDQFISAKAYTVTQENLIQSHRKLPFQAALPNTASSPTSHTHFLNWNNHLILFNTLKYVQREGQTQQKSVDLGSQ